MDWQPHLAFDALSIIGRTQERQVIEAALGEPQTPSRVIIIKGPGGIGKTRLLRYALELAIDRGLLCSGIVDLYDPRVHSNSGIERAILGVVNGVSNVSSEDDKDTLQGHLSGVDPDRRYFANYWERRKLLEEALTGLPSIQVEAARQAVTEAFVHDLNSLAVTAKQRRQPIVLMFDTAELMQFESDLIQHICQIQDRAIEVKGWITSVLPRLENCFILIAGRGPRPNVKKDPRVILWKDIEDALSLMSPVTFDLAGLDHEEASEYFAGVKEAVQRLISLDIGRAVVETEKQDVFNQLQRWSAISDDLRKGAAKVGQVIDQLSEEDVRQICRVTEGHPIRLGLTIDLMSFGGDVSGLFDGAEKWNDLVPGIINRLEDARIGFPVSDTLDYLACTRLGLKPELLHFLNPEWSLTDCEGRMVALRALSFVKTREGSDEIFLHDEMYDLLEKHRIRPHTDIRFRDYYVRIIEFYQSQLARTDLSHEQRDSYELALLHYQLRFDARDGYHTYFRLDETAIAGRQADRDMELRDEVLRFYSVLHNSQLAERRGLSRNVIDRDCAVRWVKRHVAQNDYDLAVQVAERILSFGPESGFLLTPEIISRPKNVSIDYEERARTLFGDDDPFFWSHLLTYYGEALAHLGRELDRAEKVLKLVIAMLEPVDAGVNDKFERLLRARILGRAHNNLGFLYRRSGRFSNALEEYPKALGYFVEAEVVYEERNTRKNFAYLLGLIGRHHAARDHIERVLEENQISPMPYLNALDYNVSGYIYAWQGRPDRGVEHCEHGLKLLSGLADLRSKGLVYNGLGFCYRKWGDRWKLHKGAESRPNKDQSSEFFKRAEQFLFEAERVFVEREPEPLWETYNELGSLYCDLAYLIRHGGLSELSAEQCYGNSIGYQTKALNVAANMAHLLLESRDDLAQAFSDYGELLAEKGDITGAKAKWAEANGNLTWVEDQLEEWKVRPGRGFRDADKAGTMQWLALGKAQRQRGIWAFREYLRKKTEHETDIHGLVNEGVRHFALATAYFQQTRRTSQILEDTMEYYIRRLQQAHVDGKLAVQIIADVESEYCVDLSVLRETVADRVGL